MLLALVWLVFWGEFEVGVSYQVKLAHSVSSVTIPFLFLCPNSPQCALHSSTIQLNLIKRTFLLTKMVKEPQLHMVQRNTEGRRSVVTESGTSSSNFPVRA